MLPVDENLRNCAAPVCAANHRRTHLLIAVDRDLVEIDPSHFKEPLGAHTIATGRASKDFHFRQTSNSIERRSNSQRIRIEGRTTRAKQSRSTLDAPAFRSTFAQASDVLPLVRTSSISRMCRPSTFSRSGTANARATSRLRCVIPIPRRGRVRRTRLTRSLLTSIPRRVASDLAINAD